jgi:hypothetical protein
MLLNTLFFPTLLLLGQRMWIQYRTEYLGGPSEYYYSQYTNANYMIMGNIAQNLSMFLADTLLVSDFSFFNLPFISLNCDTVVFSLPGISVLRYLRLEITFGCSPGFMCCWHSRYDLP